MSIVDSVTVEYNTAVQTSNPLMKDAFIMLAVPPLPRFDHVPGTLCIALDIISNEATYLDLAYRAY